MGYGFKGQKEYERFKNGKKLTYRQALLAHCYECMGFYQDKKQDCFGYSCPCYQYYPYRHKKAILSV